MHFAARLRQSRILCLVLAIISVQLAVPAVGAQVWTPRPAESLNGAACTPDSGYDPARVYDAIIVGAGLSGLSAANELDHLQRSNLILEANNRIGGRAFSADIAGAMIDYGGAWIHGVPTNPLTPLADGLGFKRIRSNLDVPFFVNSTPADEQTMHTYETALDEYEQAVEMGAPAGQSQRATGLYACHALERIASRKITVAEACGQIARAGGHCRTLTTAELHRQCTLATTLPATDDSAEAYVIKNHAFADVIPVIVDNAGPLESAEELKRTSTLDTAEFAAGEDDLVDRSMGELVKTVGAKAKVCLNSPVRRIDLSRDGRVKVTAGDRVYAAKTALVTVSVGVLKAGRIDFVPRLPDDKLAAIKNLQMGNMQKVIVPFRENIFRDQKPNSWVVYEGDLTPDQAAFAEKNHLPVVEASGQGRPVKRIVMAFVLLPLEKDLAIAFYGGDWARALEAQCKGAEHTSGPQAPCDAMAVDIARTALFRMFTKEAVDRAIDASGIHVTRWSLDPTSFGAYSVAPPRMWIYKEILGDPVSDKAGVDRLYFSGEATGPPIFSGSYPAAWVSGLKAARAINATLLNAGPPEKPAAK